MNTKNNDDEETDNIENKLQQLLQRIELENSALKKILLHLSKGQTTSVNNDEEKNADDGNS